MTQHKGLDRRSFLRNTGWTALVAGAAANTPLAAAPFDLAETAQAPAGTFDFDTPYSRFGTDSVKYDQQNRLFGKGSVEVGMGIADMDFRAAPSITKALQERLQHENWGYLDTPASFAEGIIAWNKKKYNVDIKPEELIVTMGVHPGLIATLKAFSPVGSKVLLQTPTYNGFYGDLTASRTVSQEVVLKRVNGKFEMDFDAFDAAIGPDTYAFILCNPQNPTGNCWSESDLMKIGEICLKRGVLVMADEIHCDFVNKGQKYIPFANLPDKKIVNNSITYKAASKSFGLAAHKTAWFHSTNPELLAKVRIHHRAEMNTLGIVANHAAYAGGEEWLRQCVNYIDGNHDFAVDYIKKNLPLVKAYKAEGTYLMWLDMTGLAEKIDARGRAEKYNREKAANAPARKPEQMIEEWLVRNAKVHMNSGASYGKGSDNHMRMNIATSRKTLEKALSNMASAMRAGTTSMAQG